MKIRLVFKDQRTLKIKRVETEVDEPSLYSFLTNIEYFTSIMLKFEKKDEFLIGISDKD